MKNPLIYEISLPVWQLFLCFFIGNIMIGSFIIVNLMLIEMIKTIFHK